MKPAAILFTVMAFSAPAFCADASGLDGLSVSAASGMDVPSVSAFGQDRGETAGKALSSAAAKPAGPVYDAELARRLAQAAADGNAGAFGGKCYAYVAWHMHHAGILDFNGWVDMGIQPGYSDDAADFFVWADQNREKMRSEMRLAIVPTPASKEEVPVGSILVYDRGWCGFSESSGHIEVLTAPDWACSDGCESLDNNCFADASIREHVHVIIPVKN